MTYWMMPVPSAKYGKLPFKKQIEFFRQKVNLPTKTWTDIWQGQHARAFVVAGAMKDELLSDMRAAVDKAISDGTTLQAFRKDFDTMVQKHGWSYNGGRGWRTRVIYETNLRTSYQAGRYAQMQAVKQSRPFWRYKHSDSVLHPRPQHAAWNNLILHADDPFWDTHYTPNGWGCQCGIQTLSKRDLTNLGKDGPDFAPVIEYEDRKVGDRIESVPKGIDPGWAYNVGKASWGQESNNRLIDQYQGGRGWERLTSGDWLSHARPEALPIVNARAKPGPTLASTDAAIEAINKTIGGPLKVVNVNAGDFNYPLYIDADVLGRHLDLTRTPFIPLLPELFDAPTEIWQSFERSTKTGKVALRMRMIKALKTDKGRGMALVMDAQNGKMLSWTFIPYSLKKINKIRQGKLVHAQDDKTSR